MPNVSVFKKKGAESVTYSKKMLCLVLAVTTCTSVSVHSFPTFKEMYFQQRLDHFRPDVTTTWRHRYLLNDDHWGKKQQKWGSITRKKKSMACKGPILFYTGNEGPIEAFWGSNGFMIEVIINMCKPKPDSAKNKSPVSILP